MSPVGTCGGSGKDIDCALHPCQGLIRSVATSVKLCTRTAWKTSLFLVFFFPVSTARFIIRCYFDSIYFVLTVFRMCVIVFPLIFWSAIMRSFLLVDLSLFTVVYPLKYACMCFRVWLTGAYQRNSNSLVPSQGRIIVASLQFINFVVKLEG